MNKLEDILCKLFGVDASEWAISFDTRMVHNKKNRNGKPNKHYGYMKVSFHFVLWTRKVHIPELKQFIEENLGQFDRIGLKTTNI